MSIGTEALPIVSALGLLGIRLCELGTRREVVAGQIQETWTLRLFIATGLLMTGGGIWEYLHRGEHYSWGLFAVGLALAAGSFSLRHWTIRALGRYWSLHVEMREDHPLVAGGPFRWVRHPTYLSMLMELGALSLMLGAEWTLAASLVLFLPTLWWRVRVEEKALVGRFAGRYVEYARRTPALIPYKIPRKDGG